LSEAVRGSTRAELLVGHLQVAVLPLQDDDQRAEAQQRVQEEIRE
jgi:hypothetical protein